MITDSKKSSEHEKSDSYLTLKWGNTATTPAKRSERMETSLWDG